MEQWDRARGEWVEVVVNCTGWGLGVSAVMGVCVVKLHGRCHTLIPTTTPRPYTVRMTATPAGSLLTHSILSPPMLTEYTVPFCIVVLPWPVYPEDEGTTFLQNIRGYCVRTQHHISEDFIVLNNTAPLWDSQILQGSFSLSFKVHWQQWDVMNKPYEPILACN